MEKNSKETGVETLCIAYSSAKMLNMEALLSALEPERAKGKTVVTLNGSFDLMHAGHLYILEQAALQGDILVVAVNSDASVQQYKSSLRPIVPLRYRMEMVAAIGFVSWVLSFEETDPRAILEQIKPDIHVNGAEYGADCVERVTVEKYGGRMHFVPRIPGLATSDIIRKIVQTCA